MAAIIAELHALQDSSAKFFNARRAVVDKSTNFTNTIARLGSHAKVGQSGNDTVRAFAAASARLQGFQTDLDRAFYQLLVAPTNALLNEEVKQALVLKKSYDSLHLEFDARTNKFRGLSPDPKIPDTAKRQASRAQAKLDLDIIQTKFEAVKDHLKNVCATIELKRNHILNEQLALYQKSYLVYCANCASALELHTKSALAPDNPSPTGRGASKKESGEGKSGSSPLSASGTVSPPLPGGAGSSPFDFSSTPALTQQTDAQHVR